MNVPQRQMTWDEVVAQMVVYRNERDALQAEVEKLEAASDFDHAEYKRLRGELLAELEAARKDAARLLLQLRAAFEHRQGYYMNTCFECYKSMEFVDKRCHTCSDCADKRIDAAMEVFKA